MDKAIIDLQENLNLICAGGFDKNDVSAFMMDLREFVSEKSAPVLRDLCDFFAHSKRTQGESFGWVESFLNKFIDEIEKNGSITIHPPLFNKVEIINSILLTLNSNGVKVDETAFKTQADKFVNLLLDSLDKIEYKSKNPKVKSCFIKKEGEKAYFCFLLQNISQSAQIRRDGPGQTCVEIFYAGNKDSRSFTKYKVYFK
jgi:hypothetical protein